MCSVNFSVLSKQLKWFILLLQCPQGHGICENSFSTIHTSLHRFSDKNFVTLNISVDTRLLYYICMSGSKAPPPWNRKQCGIGNYALDKKLPPCQGITGNLGPEMEKGRTKRPIVWLPMKIIRSIALNKYHTFAP